MPIIVSIYFNIKLTNPTVTQCKIELSGMIMCVTGNRAVRRGTGEQALIFIHVIKAEQEVSVCLITYLFAVQRHDFLNISGSHIIAIENSQIISTALKPHNIHATFLHLSVLVRPLMLSHYHLSKVYAYSTSHFITMTIIDGHRRYVKDLLRRRRGGGGVSGLSQQLFIIYKIFITTNNELMFIENDRMH